MKPSPYRIPKIDERTFNLRVLQSPHPVLVAFLASWSRPCRVMRQVLGSIATSESPGLKIFQAEADERLELSLSYDIQSIPTLLLFVDGQIRIRIVGTATKEAVMKRINRFILTS
jgi:thioredoxin 1